MATEAALRQLQDLGFNQLEAEVYVFLLANKPATAYAVGKGLGRPTANVYKAVDALSRRGAVLIEEGDNRLCRAVPADEFLDQMRQSFRAKTEATAEALAKLERQSEDERVYRLESVPQLFERCRQMLEERCERCAVIDAFPGPLHAILPAIESAVARGVRLYVEAYEPIRIKGADVVVTDLGPQVLEQWRGQQLNVVVDGRESLTALLDAEMKEVHQGLWTNSLYLSCLMHSGRLAEHTLIRLLNSPEAKLKAVLKSHAFLLNSDVPGHRELLARYARN
jgi:HTH-type transcriptional regulator, sugar sensing transcriptional regulator